MEDGSPVDADAFGEDFLGEVCGSPGGADSVADLLPPLHHLVILHLLQVGGALGICLYVADDIL